MSFIVENGILKKYTGRDEQIIIPDGVIIIGIRAFEGCSHIKSVIIPDSVKAIDNLAFSGCQNLESITIPHTVTGVNSWEAEASSDNAYSIYEKGSGLNPLGFALFKDCTALRAVTLPDCLSAIPDETFSGCTKLETLILPESVTEIGTNAFYNCKTLKSINLPAGIDCIKSGAFCNCESLADISVPETAYTGASAFCGCKSLADKEGFVIINGILYSCYNDNETVCIPSQVTEIDIPSFRKCITSKTKKITSPRASLSMRALSSLDLFTDSKGFIVIDNNFLGYNPTPENKNNIHFSDTLPDKKEIRRQKRAKEQTICFPRNISGIADYAFSKSKQLLSITVPSGVTAIGKYAFAGCTELRTAVISNTVTALGEGAFEGCSSLESLTLSDNISHIGEWTFHDCSALKEITLPTTIKQLPCGIFCGCGQIESVTIPQGTESIGAYAFKDCSQLAEIIIPHTVTDISPTAFSGCPSVTICGKEESFAAEYARIHHIPLRST